jgi:acetyl esterase/lipase
VTASSILATVLRLLTLTLVVSSAVAAQTTPIRVDSDGVVHVPPIRVPLSSYLSREAKAAFVEDHFRLDSFETKVEGQDVATMQAAAIGYFQPTVRKTLVLYPMKTSRIMSSGVYVDVFEPRDGVLEKNRHRVLINLHGGGFTGVLGPREVLDSIPVSTMGSNALEAIGVAGRGKVRVVNVDYRLGPKDKFPSASEDVVAVYRDLLKTYKPSSIGIYGCSAGGLLTAEVMAWIDRNNLPRPGALGIFCASAGGGDSGDSDLLYVLSGMPDAPVHRTAPHPQVGNVPYFRDADMNDPLVFPVRSPSLLRRFPPTLVITGTRDDAMSSAIYTHSQLVKAGVESELHVWEGMGHAFFVFHPDLPESRDALDVIVKFFDRHLQ